jgi:hypothetical protein
MSETRILIRLLRIYFLRNWQFGSALSKLRNFGGEGGLNPPTPPSVRHWFTACISLLTMRDENESWNLSCTPSDVAKTFRSSHFYLVQLESSESCFLCYGCFTPRSSEISGRGRILVAVCMSSAHGPFLSICGRWLSLWSVVLFHCLGISGVWLSFTLYGATPCTSSVT